MTMNKVTVLAVAFASSVVLAQGFVAAGAAEAVAGSGSSATAQAQAPASKAHVLSKAEIDNVLANPGKFLVIDVRRPDEVTAIGGLPVYLSIQNKDLESSLAWIPKGRQIVTLSNHAGRAAKAAELLAAKGFKVAGAAGAQTYEQQGGTIAHIQAPAAKTADAAAH